MIKLELNSNPTPWDTITLGKTTYTFTNKHLGCNKKEILIYPTILDTLKSFLSKIPNKYYWHILHWTMPKKKWFFFTVQIPFYSLYVWIPNKSEDFEFFTNLDEAGTIITKITK